MNIYETLGIQPVINAQATLTRLGGSLMPPEVLAAMADAARSFINLDELQLRVGERIADLTHNDAAYVSSGAAAGLVLATASWLANTMRFTSVTVWLWWTMTNASAVVPAPKSAPRMPCAGTLSQGR